MFLLLVRLVVGCVLRPAAGDRVVAQLEVENVALRDEAVLRRSVKRPPSRRRDRILLAAASRL
jgi:hypothetical protein